ncbi:Innexin inx3 [Frankliniella fusca]|uniref:Innexin n=1 Tax=Frankliniella fusca TaxID=407009 RepID=A0AAE1HYH1_9NEOP|nr:Innexin inx3 [Frankliniella fusca]
MLTVFGALRGVVRSNAPGEVHLSTVWSAFHHRLTAVLLLFLMLLVSARQYLGEPVQCVQQHRDDAAVPERVMNTYCFIATTYTVVRPRPRRAPWGGPPAGVVRGALHPGLQGLVHNLGADPLLEEHAPAQDVVDEQGASVRRHAYYQWVPLVLGLQAALFAAPYVLWTLWEGGLVAGALRGLRLQEVVPADKRRAQVRLLARYFRGTLNSHSAWAAGYWSAELLNLLNVLLNVLALDALLGGRFLSYGLHVLAQDTAAPAAPPAHPQLLQPRRAPDPYPDWDPLPHQHRPPADPLDHPEDPADPMEAVFPKLTKCTFFKYGPSGSIQRHDALCVMALNVVNEKVFVLLWCWFALLAAVSLLIVVRSCAALAAYACARRSASRNRLTLWVFGRLLGLPPLPAAVLETLAAHLDPGDWLFLLLLAKNMPRVVYRCLAEEIAAILGPGPGPSASAPPGPPGRPPERAQDLVDALVPLVEVTT